MLRGTDLVGLSVECFRFGVELRMMPSFGVSAWLSGNGVELLDRYVQPFEIEVPANSAVRAGGTRPTE